MLKFHDSVPVGEPKWVYQTILPGCTKVIPKVLTELESLDAEISGDALVEIFYLIMT